MDQNKIRGKAIRLAHENPALRTQLLPLVKKASGKRVLTASQRGNLVDAIRIAQGMDIEAADIILDKMPGFSPMQLRQHIDKIASTQREIKIMEDRLQAELTKLRSLEKEEKDGVATLKKAASELGKKGQMCAQAETALLKFTAYAQEKRPGIEQMIADPTDSKFGDKAGDLFGRIAAKLGAEIAADVQVIYTQCSEDLTHTAMAIKGLKVISKTAGIHPTIVKNAGLADTIIDIKEWLTGGVNLVTKTIIGFAGNIERWYKGFVERTKLVSTAKTDLEKTLAAAKKDTDKLLA